MLKKLSVQLLLSVMLFTAGQALAQDSTLKKGPGKDLVIALGRLARLPRPLADEGGSYAFALKFVFSENGNIDTIISSKYTPRELKQSVTQPGGYQHVNWNSLFNRKVVKGDILIVPISIYNPESSKMLPEYHVDDLLNFSFPSESDKLIPCVVMQTVVLQYYNAKK